MLDSEADTASLRVVTWNVQTFFDVTPDGTEYSDFKKSKQWNRDAYMQRLRRLCAAARTLDADILVMEEIENEAVLHDLDNFLAGEWNFRKRYVNACFAKEAGSAIGCAVLSRYPLSDMTVHALDIRSEAMATPSLRPLMQVCVHKGDRDLILFVSHWKSKSGGETVADVWQRWQEAVLAERIITCGDKAVLSCGDFNRDITAFCRDDSDARRVLLRPLPVLSGRTAAQVYVYTPWCDGGGALVDPGSYYFHDEWSRIDQFFSTGQAEIVDFTVETKGPWCGKEDFRPFRYKLWTGNGYSDHLPLSCTVRF